MITISPWSPRPVMLKGYAHIMKFFANFEWWKTEPRPNPAAENAFCLAQPGQAYAIYLPCGGSTTVTLEAGS